MKKGFSILVAAVVAAGLCACGPSSQETSPGEGSAATHASQVHALRTQPICRAQFMCAV